MNIIVQSDLIQIKCFKYTDRCGWLPSCPDCYKCLWLKIGPGNFSRDCVSARRKNLSVILRRWPQHSYIRPVEIITVDAFYKALDSWHIPC